MSKMINLLHDRIDEAEALREKARETVERVIKAKLQTAVEASNGDYEKAFLILAALVGDELAALTTESVQQGIAYAQRRAERARSV